MGADWAVAALGDLGAIVTGTTPPSGEPELFGNTHPFLTPTDMLYDARYVETSRSISEEGRQRFVTRIVPANAVSFVCIGATIGKVAMTSVPTLTNQQINTIIVDSDRHEPAFVYYLLRHHWSEIRNHAGGAATPILNKSAFARIELPVPPLPVQRKIASVLGAYDELIENNLRRIEILEDMAQAIYREWFVNFRYPGHEGDELVDGPMGPIPEGWDLAAFGDLAAEVKDGVNPSDLDPTFPYVGLEHIPRQSFTLTSAGTVESVASRKWRFQDGDILFGKLRPYFHKVVEAHFDGVCSTDAIVMRPRVDHRDLALMVAFSAEFVAHAVGTSGGTDRPRAKWSDLAKFPLAKPPRPLEARFSEAVRPIIELAGILARQNTNLRSTRNLLLPKLVSGEIDVSDLDIDTSWLAA